MATNPFLDFVSGEALTGQPEMSYLSMLGAQPRSAADNPFQVASAPARAQSEMFGSPFGTSPAARRYFQGQFQNIYDEFLGKQGEALRGGALPAQTFQQFLDAFPFTQRYAALPPAMTGRTLSGFAPRVQYSYL